MRIISKFLLLRVFQSRGGDAIFSLFPFANDPNGVYGQNTFTQSLSTDARGRIFSGRYDWNIFEINGNQQTFTARYNNTDDRRDLTDVGGALFSAVRPLVRTDNFSTYLTGGLTANMTQMNFDFLWAYAAQVWRASRQYVFASVGAVWKYSFPVKCPLLQNVNKP